MEGLKVGKLAAARPCQEKPKELFYSRLSPPTRIGISKTRLVSRAQPCISKAFLVGEMLVKLSEMT
jgi:hypothetical protein